MNNQFLLDKYVSFVVFGNGSNFCVLRYEGITSPSSEDLVKGAGFMPPSCFSIRD